MIGQSFGHYTILEKIGAGGMGHVYRARDMRLERDVAVKVLPPGSLPDPAARKRFRQEALALSKLNHPNIATVHDFNTQDDVDFIVMELITGKTLAAVIGSVGLPHRCLCAWRSPLRDGHRRSALQGHPKHATDRCHPAPARRPAAHSEPKDFRRPGIHHHKMPGEGPREPVSVGGRGGSRPPKARYLQCLCPTLYIQKDRPDLVVVAGRTGDRRIDCIDRYFAAEAAGCDRQCST